MENILFPEWLGYAGFFLFLKLYNPTRLFLDNITITSISIVFAIYITGSKDEIPLDYKWVVECLLYAILVSIPFQLSSMMGSIIQQLLLLNEQSVQDKRFTEESEALARMSGLLFAMYAVDSGVLFVPLAHLLNGDIKFTLNIYDTDAFKALYMFIVEHMKQAIIVASKYIVILIAIPISVAMIDMYFKKSSLSTFITSDLKIMLVIVLLNTWFFNDQLYLFQKFMER